MISIRGMKISILALSMVAGMQFAHMQPAQAQLLVPKKENGANGQKKALTLRDCKASYAGRDYRTAMNCFARLAQQGSAEAQYQMGQMMFNGRGTTKNIYGAYPWFEKAAKQGHMKSQAFLGYMHANGVGAKKDEKRAVIYYTKAAKQGDAAAQNNLGNMLRAGRGWKADKQAAAKWYLQAATQNFAQAQVNLANMYIEGDGIKKNVEEAIKWYSQAALYGNSDAQRSLGVIYENGLGGISKDIPKARGWYEKAAAQGNLEAIFSLAVFYEKGLVKDKYYSDAALLYNQAALRGHMRSRYRLAQLFEQGRGVEKDLKKARDFYRLGVNAHHLPSKRAYALMVLKNFKDSPQDLFMAKKLLKDLANFGEGIAQFELAKLYVAEDENGYSRLNEAYFWFSLAVESLPDGEEKQEAIVARTAIQSELDATQIDHVKKQLALWKPYDMPERMILE